MITKLKKIKKSNCLIVIGLLIFICGCFYYAFQKEIKQKYNEHLTVKNSKGFWLVSLPDFDSLFEINIDDDNSYMLITKTEGEFTKGSRFALRELKFGENSISFHVELKFMMDSRLAYSYMFFNLKLEPHLMTGKMIARTYGEKNKIQNEKTVATIFHKK